MDLDKYKLYHIIRGSNLYGLETENSDIDTYLVYCAPEEWILGSGLYYKPHIFDEAGDHPASELSKYFRELGRSNPDALISLFAPEDKILYKSPLLDPLINIRDSLITKECFKSFKGYAKSQIGKAKGLNKSLNMNPEEVRHRKTPLDFCWTDKNISLLQYLKDNGLSQEYCGARKLHNGVEFYTLFYDWFSDPNMTFEKYIYH